MTAATTAQLGLTEIESASQHNQHVTVNGATRVIDAHLHLAVISRALTAPPGGETEGNRYMPAATATGDWATHENEIALYTNGAYVFQEPKEGWLCWAVNEKKLFRFDGTAWVEVSIVVAQSKDIVVPNPTGAMNYSIFYTLRAITIRSLAAVVQGSITHSLTWNVKFAATRNSGSPTAVMAADQVTTSLTTADVITDFTGGDASIPAGSFVWLSSSAIASMVTEFALSIFFTEDQS